MKRKLTKRKRKWIERTVDNDRSYKIWLYNRFFLYILLALIQLAGWAAFLYLLHYNSKIAVLAQGITGALAFVSVLYIVGKPSLPSAKLGWVLLILILPFFGVSLYAVCGEGRSTRRMKNRLEKTKAENRRNAQAFAGQELSLPQTREEGTEYFLSTRGYPAYTDGEAQYFDSGEKMFPEMLSAIQSAKRFILVEYFIIAHGKMWGELLKLLLQKAEEGVQIRILYDDFGCMTTLPPDYDRYLESLNENIRCLSFNKVIPLLTVRMNNRDHRKMLVIDGEIAFTGGINLADEYIGEKRRFGYWKDSGLKITGGAVNSFTQAFFDLWNAFRTDKEEVEKYLVTPFNEDIPPANGQKIQPFDVSPLDKISVGAHVYADMIARAKKSAYIFTPYLVLDDFLRAELCRAALRGVDVRIVTPSIPDKKTVYRLTRANYAVLMEAGVKIYEYTPGFIHAKSFLCDGEYAVVGTINFDYRSLYLHFENGVYFSGGQAVADLERDCMQTFALSKLCDKNSVRRGLIGRTVDAVLRVFESLL